MISSPPQVQNKTVRKTPPQAILWETLQNIFPDTLEHVEGFLRQWCNDTVTMKFIELLLMDKNPASVDLVNIKILWHSNLVIPTGAGCCSSTTWTSLKRDCDLKSFLESSCHIHRHVLLVLYDFLACNILYRSHQREVSSLPVQSISSTNPSSLHRWWVDNSPPFPPKTHLNPWRSRDVCRSRRRQRKTCSPQWPRWESSPIPHYPAVSFWHSISLKLQNCCWKIIWCLGFPPIKCETSLVWIERKKTQCPVDCAVKRVEIVGVPWRETYLMVLPCISIQQASYDHLLGESDMEAFISYNWSVEII